jgi:hypothetical protein
MWSGADPMHPGVDLEVHFVTLAGGGEGVDERPGVHRRGQIPLGHLGCRLWLGLAEEQDRRLDAGLPEPDTFLDQGHGEEIGPGVESSVGHRNVAVAVGVGFDHGANLRRSDEMFEGGDVVGDGVEVDLDVGRSHHAWTDM